MTPLSALLHKELALLGQFLEVLAQEQNALQQGNAEQLTQLTQTKLQQIQELDNADKQRNRFVEQQGFSADRQGIEAYLTKTGEKQAGDLWLSLLQKAAEARSQNLLNGQLISIRLQSSNQALDVLTHHTPKSTLYGPDGQTKGISGGRIIESA